MRIFFKNSILIIIWLCGLSSCQSYVKKVIVNGPDREFQMDLSEASPDFRDGWRDGCDTGRSAGTNPFYKLIYRNDVVDGFKMSNSSDYKIAWGDAFWYCFRKDWVKQKSSIWSATFGGYR